MLAREGARTRDGEPGESTWRFQTTMAHGMACEIRCTGPDLPDSVPSHTVSPADIPKDPKWRGLYRLVVAPPLIALDLCWRPGEPLRIMTFSRGDWEDALSAMAAATGGARG